MRLCPKVTIWRVALSYCFLWKTEVALSCEAAQRENLIHLERYDTQKKGSSRLLILIHPHDRDMENTYRSLHSSIIYYSGRNTRKKIMVLIWSEVTSVIHGYKVHTVTVLSYTISNACLNLEV